MCAWSTHRGDEWWYEGFTIQASAGSAANIVSIGDIAGAKGRFSEAEFHHFLKETFDRFSDSQILVSLNSSNVEYMLQELKEKGLVSFEAMASRFSKEAKINFVAPLSGQTSSAEEKE